MTKRSITIDLPFPLTMNSIWRISGSRIIPSAKYKAWKEEALWSIKAQRINYKINGKYEILVTAVRPDKRKRDLDNILKVVSDVLMGSGIIGDDSDCEILSARWEDSGSPCRVTVWEL